MRKFTYKELYETIMNSEKYDQKQKKMMVRLLDFVYTYPDDKLKSCEDKTYTVDGETLLDSERIRLELQRIKYLNNNEISKEEKFNNKYNIFLKKYLKDIENSNNIDYTKMKEDITEYQIENGICPKFYSSFDGVLNKNLNISDDDEEIKNKL